MKPILTFDGAVKRDPAIDAWLRGVRAELRPLAERWITRMRERGADVVELMHDGAPTACVGDVPFCYVNAYTAHVNVGFFHGHVLEDPAGLLEGTGKRMRHVKLKPGHAVDANALAKLVEAAYREAQRLRLLHG